MQTKSLPFKSRFYGRRQTRTLRRSLQECFDQLGPVFSIESYMEKTPCAALELDDLFGNEMQEYRLEIGFGAGEHLAGMAAINPHIGFIGIEPFKNGQAKLLSQIAKQGLKNIRFFGDSVHHLFEFLPQEKFSCIYLHYPDPWPKKRHHFRRMIQFDTIKTFANLLRSKGKLHITSDHKDYLCWILQHMEAMHALFMWEATLPKHWQQPAPDWISTRYEQKALQAGDQPTYLHYVKQNGAEI